MSRGSQYPGAERVGTGRLAGTRQQKSDQLLLSNVRVRTDEAAKTGQARANREGVCQQTSRAVETRQRESGAKEPPKNAEKSADLQKLDQRLSTIRLGKSMSNSHAARNGRGGRRRQNKK